MEEDRAPPTCFMPAWAMLGVASKISLQGNTPANGMLHVGKRVSHADPARHLCPTCFMPAWAMLGVASKISLQGNTPANGMLHVGKCVSHADPARHLCPTCFMPTCALSSWGLALLGVGCNPHSFNSKHGFHGRADARVRCVCVLRTGHVEHHHSRQVNPAGHLGHLCKNVDGSSVRLASD
eukprot:1158027-Pelagomonas_calceolata.AAC.3